MISYKERQKQYEIIKPSSRRADYISLEISIDDESSIEGFEIDEQEMLDTLTNHLRGLNISLNNLHRGIQESFERMDAMEKK